MPDSAADPLPDLAVLLAGAQAHAREGRVSEALAAAAQLLAGLDRDATGEAAAALLARSREQEAQGDLRGALDSLRRHVALCEAVAAARLELRDQALALQSALERRAPGREGVRPGPSLDSASLVDGAQLEAAADRLAQQHPGAPQVLLLVGLDHFARVNSAWSRATGDAVLQACATLLRGQSRPQDVLARLAGDRFAIVPAGAVSTTRALLVAERLRVAIESHDWPALQSGLAVSASVGVAGRASGEPLAAVLARAEAALGRCKRGGRNQVRT